MGQKINPIALRLGQNRTQESSWYSGQFYKKCLALDLSLNEYYNQFLKHFKLPNGRIGVQLGINQLKAFPFICIPKNSRFIRARGFKLALPKTIQKPSTDIKPLIEEKNYKVENKGKLNNIYKDLVLSGNTNVNTNALLGSKEGVENFYKFQLFLYRYKSLLNTYSTMYSSEELAAKNSFLTDLSTNVNPKYKKLNSKLFSYNSSTKLSQNRRINSVNSSLLDQIESSPDILTNILAFEIIKKELSTLKVQDQLETRLSNFSNLDVQLTPFVVSNDWQSASYLADEIVFFLEKRVHFMRIKNRLLRQVEILPWIKGIRIICSGRLGGKGKRAQRATQEYFKYGETPLHIFNRKIDFASRTAYTPFGTLGIKIWICYK